MSVASVMHRRRVGNTSTTRRRRIVGTSRRVGDTSARDASRWLYGELMI
jgi:hypothetical protein